MSNKSFKSEYKGYMKDIKPSQELIDKTIMLAHQEQQDLQRAKSQTTYKTIHRLNFKKYTALACTLIFAIFAVKLWSDQSKESIPSLPVETTVTSTNDSTDTHTDTTTPSNSQTTEGQLITDVSTFDYNIDSTVEDTTPSNEQSVSVTTPSSSDSNHTNTISNSNTSTSVTSITTNANAIENEPSTVVTTIPSGTTYTESSTNNESMSSSNSSTQTSVSSSESSSSSSVTTAPTTKPIDNIISISTIPDDEINNAVTTTTTTIPDDECAVATTIDHNSTVTTTSVYISEDSSNSECTTINGSLGGIAGEEEPPSANNGGSTWIEMSPTPDDAAAQYSTYGAYKVVLYDTIAGFAYNNIILQGRIKNYFSFGNDIECIIPMGNYNSTSDCYAIIVVNTVNTSSAEIVNEIKDCKYCYLPSTTDYASYFESTVEHLDFNQNGIYAFDDDEDKQTILKYYIS